MPTYQYRCKECGHDFEIVQAFSDDALTKCPECKKKALKKVYGNVGISFKGSGFYKNDARSSSGSKSSSNDSSKSTDKGSDTKSDTSADTKSDTKSDKKSDTKSDKKSEKKSSSTSSSD